jgi:hypothetical protein
MSTAWEDGTDLAPEDAAKATRVAAFIFSVQGDKAVEYARQLEAESAVPDMARRVRMEVERLVQLVQAEAPALDIHAGPAGLSEGS